MVCIILNTLVLGMTWLGEPPIISQVTEIMNYVFSGIFALEAMIKIIGMGRRPYFKDSWNWFDFFIVCGTVLSISITVFTNIEIGPQTTLIRAFRISRIFRLVKKARRLQIIFETFIVTIPALTNVGGLLVLFLYLYSIMGVSLFAKVKL